MQLYHEIKSKLDSVEENNKKAKKVLDTMDKLTSKYPISPSPLPNPNPIGGYKPYNVTDM
jgi:hypothetical protein